MRRALALVLLLTACGAEPEHAPRGSADGGVRADAAPLPYDGRACEPDLSICRAALDTCAAGADVAGQIACETAFSTCGVAELESHRGCFESYACTAALEQLDCLAKCETTYRECIAPAASPHDLSVCGGLAEDCALYGCDVPRWRSRIDGQPACR